MSNSKQLEAEVDNLIEKFGFPDTPEGEIMKREFRNLLLKEEAGLSFDPSKLKHGLYEIFWRSGGSSLASVGSYSDGKRWFAATNWLNGEWADWSVVLYVRLIRAA